MLDSLIGKTVAEQAAAGYSTSWMRSDLLRSIKTRQDVEEFTVILSQINDTDMDEKMQLYYKKVRAFVQDPGSADDDPNKIEECLKLAVAALEVKHITMEAVMLAKGRLFKEQGKIQISSMEGSGTEDPNGQSGETEEVLEALAPLKGEVPTREEFLERHVLTKVRSECRYLSRLILAEASRT
jgi:hypothetical protein